jgi:hypothetical protein
MHINKKLMLAAAANDPEYLRYAIIISNGLHVFSKRADGSFAREKRKYRTRRVFMSAAGIKFIQTG